MYTTFKWSNSKGHSTTISSLPLFLPFKPVMNGAILFTFCLTLINLQGNWIIKNDSLVYQLLRHGYRRPCPPSIPLMRLCTQKWIFTHHLQNSPSCQWKVKCHFGILKRVTVTVKCQCYSKDSDYKTFFVPLALQPVLRTAKSPFHSCKGEKKMGEFSFLGALYL